MLLLVGVAVAIYFLVRATAPTSSRATFINLYGVTLFLSFTNSFVPVLLRRLIPYEQYVWHMRDNVANGC